MLVVERKCDAAPSRFTIVNECKNGLVSNSLGVTTERDQQQKELRNEKREKKTAPHDLSSSKNKNGSEYIKNEGRKIRGKPCWEAPNVSGPQRRARPSREERRERCGFPCTSYTSIKWQSWTTLVLFSFNIQRRDTPPPFFKDRQLSC